MCVEAYEGWNGIIEIMLLWILVANKAQLMSKVFKQSLKYQNRN